MKRCVEKIVCYRWLLLVALVLVIKMTVPVCSQTSASILIEKSPANGGSVTPDTGVHNVDAAQPVTLTATPKPGYQFVYWIGDVSDPASSTTTALGDSPKIIVAVFERVNFDFVALEERAKSAPVGGLTGVAADLSTGSGGGGGGARRDSVRFPSFEEPEINEDLPVPPEMENDDFPVPPEIPEPATVGLLSIGAIWLLKQRRYRRHTS